MSTVATPPTRQWTPAGQMPEIRKVPLGRLILVELRKMVDTRAGRWLLIVMALLVLLLLGANVIWGSTQDSSLQTFLQMALFPMSILVPVLGVLAATSEWSQRTGLVTFALEPRRGRVILAKIIASLILGLAVFAVGVLGAIAATAVAGQRHNGIDWSVPAAMAAGIVLALILGILQGVGFGFSFLNTPLAITALVLLPTAFSIVGSISERTKDIIEWLDMNRTTGPLIMGQMNSESWQKLAVSAALWVLLPLAIGAWRVLRREVK